jgi:hypothetical protein
MKRRAFIVCGLFILMSAVPVWAYVEVLIEPDWCQQFTGVNLPATDHGFVRFGKNEPVIGKVVDADRLMSYGLKGVKNGDEIKATWLGPGKNFKFTHPPSGTSVEIVFPQDKLKVKYFMG